MYTSDKGSIPYYRVCYLAGEFARSLKQKMEEDVKNIPDEEKHLWVFTEEEILCTQIAGLCHDLGKLLYTPPLT